MPENISGSTKSSVNLRVGPGTNFNIIATLQPNTAVVILEEHNKWLKVRANGSEGFIHRAFVLLPTQETPSGFLIHLSELNLVELPPTVPLDAPTNAGPSAKAVTRIWNKYGRLLEVLAAKLNISPGIAVAIVAAESGGLGFKNGRMIIRFENHYFWRLWGKNNAAIFNSFFRFNKAKPWKDHQFRPSTNEPWTGFHGSQEAEWTVFDKGQGLNENAAKSSISMGLPQIMGKNHTKIGYESAEEMFAAFNTNERIQLIGLFDFIQGPNVVNSPMLEALQNENFVAFAASYNGPGQASHYGLTIRQLFDAFGTLPT